MNEQESMMCESMKKTDEVFGYVKTGQKRYELERGDQWMASSGAVNTAIGRANAADHNGGILYDIARPLIRGRDLVVDAALVERLREAYATRDRWPLTDGMNHAIHALLSSLPPAAPVDPLERFDALIDKLLSGRGVGNERDAVLELRQLFTELAKRPGSATDRGE